MKKRDKVIVPGGWNFHVGRSGAEEGRGDYR